MLEYFTFVSAADDVPVPWHRHPLVTVAVGFILSGILLTIITRWLQERGAHDELKRALVQTMTEEVHRMINAVQSTEVDTGTPDLKDLNDTWLKWKTAAAVVSRKVRLYFVSSGLEQLWSALVERVDAFYAMQEERDSTVRDQRILGAMQTAVQGRTLTAAEQQWVAHGIPIVRVHWSWLRDELLDDLNAIETRILGARISPWRPTKPWYRIWPR
jgi:hypothetical protein